MRTKPITPKQFWDRVAKLGNSECWPWKLACNPAGYGLVNYDGRCRLAHRIAWLFTHGNLPSDKHICHHCDNPPCCNPAHLFCGTDKDNMADAKRKGRLPSRKGENGGK